MQKTARDPITDVEIRFAHLLLSGEMTDEQAALKAGLKASSAYYTKSKPRVRKYMAEHRAQVRDGLVQHEVEALAEFNISREQILSKYWEFANIDPKLTGYNTSSQSKALDSLWKALGFEEPQSTEGESPKNDFYQAAWMRERRDLQ